MKIIKRLIIFWMVMIMSISMVNCGGGKKAEVSALSYEKPIAVADMDAYQRESKGDGTSNATKKNNAPTQNGVVICPFYTLKVNGKEIPVYSTRCTNSTHSFAWIDVENAPDNFTLDVELTTQKTYTSALVLPEKSGVSANLSGQKVTAKITEYGDYSFVFSTDKRKTIKNTNQPLTLIVAPKHQPEVPAGYEYMEIEPGTYGYDDLKLQSNTFYLFKKGNYDIRRIVVSQKENVEIYFEPGAYLSVYETPTIAVDQYGICGPVFNVSQSENISIKGRGLFDFSAVRGWFKKADGSDQDMTQYVFNFYNNKNMYISGITTINSNHWTFRIGACEDILAEWILMLGYRNYSDGFIYSDCVNATARYMFARTGDDGIEVKALGAYGGYKDTIPVATNVLFEKCTVWNDSAAALGVIYENYKPIDGVVFRDCSVGFSTVGSTNANNAPLNVRLSYPGTALWKNITFEDIEIYSCGQSAFTLEWNMSGGWVENVLVKDITVKNAAAGIRVNDDSGKFDDQALALRCKNFVFENFVFKNKKLTEADKETWYFSYSRPSLKNLFTVK